MDPAFSHPRAAAAEPAQGGPPGFSPPVLSVPHPPRALAQQYPPAAGYAHGGQPTAAFATHAAGPVAASPDTRQPFATNGKLVEHGLGGATPAGVPQWAVGQQAAGNVPGGPFGGAAAPAVTAAAAGAAHEVREPEQQARPQQARGTLQQPEACAAGRPELAKQQTLIFKLPAPMIAGRRGVIPAEKARAAGLRGKFVSREVFVPKLRREVTLTMGWSRGSYTLGAGWVALLHEMGLSTRTALDLTVADGKICRVERAVPNAPAQVVTFPAIHAEHAEHGSGRAVPADAPQAEVQPQAVGTLPGAAAAVVAAAAAVHVLHQPPSQQGPVSNQQPQQQLAEHRPPAQPPALQPTAASWESELHPTARPSDALAVVGDHPNGVHGHPETAAEVPISGRSGDACAHGRASQCAGADAARRRREANQAAGNSSGSF